MSKSIKDYREAMDNIKISDSFYKRTETLLSELPETKLTPVSPAGSVRRWIPTVLTAAAACLIFAFGIRFAAGNSSETSEITTEKIVVTTSETVYEETGTAAAAPLVDIPGEEDELDKLMTEEGTAENDRAEKENTAKEKKDKEERPAKDKNEKEKDEKDNGSAAETEKASSDDTAEPEQGAGAVPAEGSPDVSDNREEPKTDVYVPEEETENEEELDENSQDDNGSSYSATNSVNVSFLPEGISYDSINVKLTPYFDMDGISSGRTVVTASGNDCKDIIEFISDAVSRARETETPSDTAAPKLKFRLDISEAETGKTLCTVRIAEGGVMTADGVNGKNAYALSSADGEVLEHILFLRFAAEDDYEKYILL